MQQQIYSVWSQDLQTLWILQTPEPEFYHAHDAERDVTEEVFFYPAWLHHLLFFLRVKRSTYFLTNQKLQLLPEELRITQFTLSKAIGFQNCIQVRERVRPNKQGTS